MIYVLIAILLCLAMPLRRLFRRKPKPLFRWAGRGWDWKSIQQGLIVYGGIGSGKTYSTEQFIRHLIRAGCPMLVTCVKPDEYERYVKICSGLGASHRLRRIAPDNPDTAIDLAGQLIKDGNTAELAAVITMVADVEKKDSGGGDGGAIWRNLEDGVVRYAARLSLLVTGKATLNDIYEIATSSPNSPASAKLDEYKPSLDGARTTVYGWAIHELYKKAQADPRLDGELKRIHKFFTTEFCATDKIYGGVIAGLNGTLGRFRDPPLRDALNRDALTPEMIEKQSLIAVIDYPLMTYHTPARLYNLIWVLLTQRYLMGRDASKIERPFITVRDEAGWTMHGQWDTKAQNTLRSQKCADIALVQDLDTLKDALGGGQAASHQAMAFASNHMHKIFFANYSQETNKWASEMSGMYQEVSVSSGRNEPQDFAGRALGASSVNWSLHYQPVVRSEHFNQLPVGCAYVMSGGSVRLVDFRRES